MASSSSSSSSSPSTIQQRGSLYDVFLSFSGTETRKTFISHLLDALNQRGVSTFHDETKLQRGEDIRSQLPTAISEFRVSIVVFSKNYPSSGWCLEELVKIMDCKRRFNQIVLPIFYNVKPIEVRYQRGCYAEAFKNHEERFRGTPFMEWVGKWRKALTDAANLSGWHLVDRDEVELIKEELIKEFVDDVKNILDKLLYCHVADRPVENRYSQFSIKEIREATNDFASSKILGQGGEAKVYLAEIYIGSNRTRVALKCFKDNSKEIEREIHALSKIHHSNIVSLLGYCNEFGHKILVYEYMENGCLSDYVKKHSRKYLSWMHRLNICLGVARGLQHLHTETDEFPKGIIHRDVKLENILMGENWVGKLSDFGILKLSSAHQDISLMTTNLKGTSGYFAPEYIRQSRITRKIDVYAFGVVLFQVLCRKMPWDREDESYDADKDEDLGLWAQQNVDSQIQEEMSGYSLKVFTDIIRRSLQADPGKRPTMDDVVLDILKALEFQDSENLAKNADNSQID